MQPTSFCNLNCRYCYVPGRTNAAVMDDRTLEAAIGKVLRSPLTASPVAFLWHAGEPLTVGLDFYRRACHLMRVHNERQLRVRQKIQTNGTLITDEWCRFFADEGFGLGVSVDGPAFLHDRQRANWAGHGSHREVMRGVELLAKHRIPFGALCVVTSATLDYPDEFYRFFIDSGFRWLGFNVEETEGTNGTSSLMTRDGEGSARTEERYTEFIERVFELWQQDPGRLVIREFRDTLQFVGAKIGDPSTRRQADETAPRNTITIQRDGAVSTNAPEFASSRDPRFNDFKFGNINEVELREVFRDRHYRRLQRAIRTSMRSCEERCMYFDLCGGRYLSNKHAEHGRVEATETVACRLHRQLVAAVILDKLSRGERSKKPPQATDRGYDAGGCAALTRRTRRTGGNS
jgi:uncharacterized protein